MTKFIIILPCLIMLLQQLNAKVEAPNYSFSIDTLSEFLPEKKIADVQSKYGKGEVLSEEAGLKTMKFSVAHIRYKFPVLVQERDGVIEDSFARLPSYFLHDIFLQSLVNRYGKQTQYKRTGEEAYYVWEIKPYKHIYSAACTITCFPIFYAVQKIENPSRSILEKMQKSNQ